MYIKVYIFGMEMSHRIHFLYQILPKIMIFFEKIAKNHFLVKKILGQPTKNNFELKMLKLLENYVKTKVYEGFSHFFD